MKTAYFDLKGGEDLVTPALSVNPGALLFSLNYEPGTVYGYRRIDGFERYDGQPKPSEASYWVLEFDAGTSEFGVNEVVTGGTSGATGEALVVTVESGSWAGNDADGYLILFNVSGTFQDDETITSTSGSATADGAATERGASNDTDDSAWLQSAIEATRDDIGQVPGSGNIRGITVYNGTVYAFRDNAGGTACVMHKATSSGWTTVDTATPYIKFDAGSTQINVGDTIEGATSGATADVTHVLVVSGTWGGGDAAGRLYLENVSGSFQDNENLQVSAGNVAVANGADTTVSLSPGGRYEFVNANFKGSADELKMYGCDGVNPAFMFDGTDFIQIETTAPTDTPKHITEHKRHLFLAMPKGEVLHSAIGDPLDITVVSGAGDIYTGDEIVGFGTVPGDTLAIFNRNRTYLLYGTSSSTWNLKLHSDESGAVEWSIQNIGSPRYLDDRGLTSLQAVQDYGDFRAATFSQRIEPLIRDKLSSTSVTASMRVKGKDQYRLYFGDGKGICARFRPDAVEFTRLDYGKTVHATCSGEKSDGTEILLFGSDDGYVYELDAGTSFDGSAIEAFLRLPFGHLKAPQHRKRYHKAVLEMDSPDATTLEFTQEYDYGNADIPRGRTQDLSTDSGGGFWGQDNYGEFLWSSQVVGTAEGYLSGVGVSMGIFIRSNATYESPHTIHGINIHYTPRGRKR